MNAASLEQFGRLERVPSLVSYGLHNLMEGGVLCLLSVLSYIVRACLKMQGVGSGNEALTHATM